MTVVDLEPLTEQELAELEGLHPSNSDSGECWGHEPGFPPPAPCQIARLAAEVRRRRAAEVAGLTSLVVALESEHACSTDCCISYHAIPVARGERTKWTRS